MDHLLELEVTNQDIERRIFAIAPFCARLAEYESQTEAYKANASGSLVRAQIKSLKKNMLNLMRELLSLHKDNDVAIESILQRVNDVDHRTETGMKAADMHRTGSSVLDKQALQKELQAMQYPLSIFGNVLVGFNALEREVSALNKQHAHGPPNNISVPPSQPEVALLAAWSRLESVLESTPRQSVKHSDASSAALNEADTSRPVSSNSSIIHNAEYSNPECTGGFDASESWIRIGGNNN